MAKSLKILFTAAEVTPLAKVGGLADVVGSLPLALAKLGHDVRIAMPRYGVVDEQVHPTTQVGSFFKVPFLRRTEQVSLRVASLNSNLPVYLVDNKTYFARPAVYGEADDLERFLFFSKAVLHLPQNLDWQPDVIHCHDWHTALVPLGAHQIEKSPATIFTIHNLAYQGAMDYPFLVYTSLRQEFLRQEEGSPSLPLNMMALGIRHADIITTVSQTYAQEILTPEYGAGLEAWLNYRKDRLLGITNGIDYQEWDPATDPLIAANYDKDSLWRKGVNKAALQSRAGFPQDPQVPLIGMVSRLDEQKGFDILDKALETVLRETNAQVVILGRGREVYHEMMLRLASQHPQRLAVIIAFDNPLAHLIYAGADLFLMPSRFEPCGLGQMIAMRYGTIPIVRRTGGLAETVPDLSADLAEGRGFVFQTYDSGALSEAVKRAAAACSQKEAWHRLMIRVMEIDFSWEASARKYQAAYQRAIHWHQGGG